MTPRNIKGSGGIDFAKQVAERNAANNRAKKIRSSGPKGAKVASGYTDRALTRLATDGDDEKEPTKDEREERIKALEEQVKLGQLDQATFEKIRDEITGGDVGATHLVKGLDRRLLERVRRGEDVMGGGTAGPEETQGVDDEFEALVENDVGPVEREKKVKKGEMAPPSAVAGGKRSRDQILAELRAQRASAAAARVAARPELGDKFRSIDARSGPKIVKDAKGREVLITRDEHGNIKKKIRKVEPAAMGDAHVEEKPKEFLDKDVFIPAPKQPVPAPEPEEESDDDIFEGVGDAYNPLGDDSDEDATIETPVQPSVPAEATPATEDPDADEGEILEPAAATTSTTSETNPTTTSPVPAPTEPAPSKPRNYFATTRSEPSNEPAAPTNPMSDPTFLAAIQRAGSLANFKMQLSANEPDDSASELRAGESEEQRAARLKRRAAMLATTDRDLDDMDMGFGSSRFEDAEDGEGEGEGGKKGKLSTWKGFGVVDDEDEGTEKKERKPRERNRKRKGDKDSAADVLGVLERRKEKK